MTSLIGLCLALCLASFALYCSQKKLRGYNDDFYALSPLTHRRVAFFALMSGGLFIGLRGFAAGFLSLWTLFLLFCILYLASFVRGALGDEEP